MRKASPHKPRTARAWTFLAATLALYGAATHMAMAKDFEVKPVTIEDKKAVFATVQSTDSIAARVRISGTIAKLNVTEGSQVKQGEVIATVADPKIGLQIDATDAQIRAAEREIENLKTELERAEALLKRGSGTKARRDQVKTQYDVALSKLEASMAQKAVIVRQLQEGDVLAPQSGRVLNVPVTVGSVVMPGEAVATIAKDNYILRLSLPERHAQFLKTGDEVEVAGRGMNCDQTCISKGTIEKVYPQIANGRVLADAKVPGLGDYFVGERILVRVGAGERLAYMVPEDAVFTRFGVDFVHAHTADGKETEIAVQTGQVHKADGKDMVEILAGLNAGDIVIQP